MKNKEFDKYYKDATKLVGDMLGRQLPVSVSYNELKEIIADEILNRIMEELKAKLIIPHFIVDEVVIKDRQVYPKHRDCNGDFELKYELAELTVFLKSIGNTTDITDNAILSSISLLFRDKEIG